MYKAAEDTINEGLGPAARYILCFFTTIFGIAMIRIAPPTDKAILFYAFGGFCLLISLVTVTKGRVRQFVGSIIGCTLFLLSGAYIVSQFTSGPLVSDSRGEPSVLNSFFFFIAFGLPGISYSIKARFGLQKKDLPKRS